ncbi:MAG TPA: hypothetical protein VJB70_05130 [Candidatus Paceibacterota bacterium]
MIDPNGLLMIEPLGKTCETLVQDELTILMSAALRNARKGHLAYRGVHMCACGRWSDNKDHFVKIQEADETVIETKTNSLATHYLMHHRSEVPKEELDKVRRLVLPDDALATENRLFSSVPRSNNPEA